MPRSGRSRGGPDVPRYLARRILFMIPLFFGITVISLFRRCTSRRAPRRTSRPKWGLRVTAEMKERLRAMYDLDKPLRPVRQVAREASRARSQGVLLAGRQAPVSAKILRRLPITVFLGVLLHGPHLPHRHPHQVLSAVQQGSCSTGSQASSSSWGSRSRPGSRCCSPSPLRPASGLAADLRASGS